MEFAEKEKGQTTVKTDPVKWILEKEYVGVARLNDPEYHSFEFLLELDKQLRNDKEFEELLRKKIRIIGETKMKDFTDAKHQQYVNEIASNIDGHVVTVSYSGTVTEQPNYVRFVAEKIVDGMISTCRSQEQELSCPR